MHFRLPEPEPARAITGSSAYLWFVVGTVSIGAFIGQVDASIVQLALPSLETAFHARLDAVSWVAIAYMLAFACALPVFARLADISGRKALYIAGFGLFGLFSALCGAAPSLESLVVLRLAQGVSGAMLGANSVVILVSAAGPSLRGEALGVMAAAQAVGLGLGPTLGGLLLGALNWRWIFWVNVPLAVLGVISGWLVVPRTAAVAKERRFDGAGALLLAPALAALLVVLAEGRVWGLSPLTLACLAGGPLLLAAFVWRETRAPAPLIDLRLFRSPAFSAGGVGVLVSYAMLYGLFFAMSFALVRGYGDSSLVAGLRLTIVPVALGIVAPFAGKASDKRPRLVMVGGMALCGIAALGLARTLTGAADGLAAVMAWLAAYGAGLGLYIAPNSSATVGAAPPEKSGVAGGLINLLRVFGSAVGVAAASTLLGWRLEGAIAEGRTTAHAPQAALLGAVAAILVMLAVFAAIGAAAALVRDREGAESIDGAGMAGANARAS